MSSDLQPRTKAFALRIIELYTRLPKSDVGRVLWLELVAESNTAPDNLVAPALDESRQLTAIFTTIDKKVKARASL